MLLAESIDVRRLYKVMIHNYMNYKPKIKDTVFIAPGAHVVGRVELGDKVSIWFNSVVRGDVDIVKIGPRTNIQDGCVLHQDKGAPLIIGADVTVAHKVLLHGCTIEDEAFIGMGAIILSNARIGKGAVVGAGSLVLQGQEIPPGMLAVGSPARVVRKLSDEEKVSFRDAANRYLLRLEEYKGMNETQE